MTDSSRKHRPVLLPAFSGASSLVIGLFFIGEDGYQLVRYAVSVLALVVVVILIQHRGWLWGLPLLVIAVAWNPAFPLPIGGTGWSVAHILGATCLLVIGLFFVRSDEGRESRPI